MRSPRCDLMMAPRSRKIDLNTAPISALLRVPQVGPALARAIMAARPYHRLSDLRDVAGVGEKLYFILRTHLSVSQPGLAHATGLESEAALPAVTSSAKLDLNSATVQQLVALPGIGRAMAEAVVAQQPFGGSRGSGTNDKAGSLMNLLRWTSVKTIKENLDPPKDYRRPFMGDLS